MMLNWVKIKICHVVSITNDPHSVLLFTLWTSCSWQTVSPRKLVVVYMGTGLYFLTKYLLLA